MCRRIRVALGSPLLLLALLCPLGGLPAAAEPRKAGVPGDALERLEDQVLAGLLRRRLALTPEQVAPALAAARAVAALRVRPESEVAAALAEEATAFAAFRAADLLNQGFAPAVEERTRKAEQAAKGLAERHVTEIERAARELAERLTPEQRASLAGLDAIGLAELLAPEP
ncbi:MAG: hypothetical protein HZA54_03240, partial [Planctomycetes bacterium]|nr:hypothetical protein [Planctomycetota bacterium]